MRLLGMFTFICLLLTGSALLAQDAAEELPVEQGYVFKWGGETLFPGGARFQVTLSRPVTDLRLVTLRIEFNGQTINRTMDLKNPVVDAPLYSEFAYIWPFPDNAELHLFEDHEVIYEWQALDSNGDVAQVRDTLLFRDDRLDWVQETDPQGFVNLTVPTGGPSPDQIRKSVQVPYNLISANVGRVETFNVLLYTDFDPLSCADHVDEKTGEHEAVTYSRVDSEAFVPCDPAQAQRYFDLSHEALVTSGSSTLTGIQTALVAYFTQQFYPDRNLPGWMVSGLSDLYTPSDKTRFLLPLRDAARTNRLLSLDAMAAASDDPLWQAQSYGMLLYVADQIGLEALYQLASAGSFDTAYASTVGQPLAALLPNLSTWIFSEQAAQAFSVSPYAQATPTPTATNTPTLTLTPTVTDTPTQTLTPTVTGTLSPTPTETPRPTHTFTPLPPSVTPRPAGSLWTPTPVPQPNLLQQPVARFGVVAFLLLLLAILALLYWILSRRHDDY